MNIENNKSERNSTVAISPDTAKKLELFCKTNNLTKKDFISLSLSYFERMGVNPAKHESPKTEMEKVIKRLDQFFAFLKKQEQDKINPMFQIITEASERIQVLIESKTTGIVKPKKLFEEAESLQDFELIEALKEYDHSKLLALQQSGYKPFSPFRFELNRSEWIQEVNNDGYSRKDLLSYYF